MTSRPWALAAAGHSFPPRLFMTVVNRIPPVQSTARVREDASCHTGHIVLRKRLFEVTSIDGQITRGHTDTLCLYRVVRKEMSPV